MAAVAALALPFSAPAHAQGAPQTVQLAKSTTSSPAPTRLRTSCSRSAVSWVSAIKLVVLPYDSLSTTGNKLVMPRTTKEALKAMTEFKYASK